MKRKERKKTGCRRGSVLAAAAAFFMAFSVPVYAEETAAVTVEYDNLSQLLVEGNLNLEQANDNYYTNKENYQQMMETLREEQEYMKFMAEHYEDEDEEAAAQYKANASILGTTASQMSKRIEALNRRSSTLSVEKNIDSYTMSAQTQMNSYNQMALNVEAKRKAVEAAQSSYDAMVVKQQTGAATADDVLTALDQLDQQKNLLSSYEQQAAVLRFNLLSMLGLADQENVVIGKIPEPDLAAIDAIDFESDRQTAVNNNRSVQSTRHANAGTTAEIQQKFKSEAEAVGSAEADITDSYQQLLAKKAEYQAALEAYESQLLAYQSLQRKQQAGMLSEAGYLQGEADYLEALAKKEAASMALTQAHQSYLWEVKGIA